MAMQFNLLPWREEQRQERFKRTRNTLLFGVGLGLLGGLGYYAWERLSLSDHTEALQMITNKNKAMVPQLAEYKVLKALEKELSNQVDAIESLQADRASVSHMVEELSLAVNQELFLTSFGLKDGSVSIQGIAKNDSQISDLMKRLRKSDWYQEPKLLSIISLPDAGEEVKQFSIVSQLLLPGSESDKGGK